MRHSKHLLLTRRKGFLIISLLFFSHIGAFGNLTADVAVPFSSSNKPTTSDIIVPLQHQHSVEIVQGNIKAYKPADFNSMKANYKAAPINIRPEKSFSSTGNLYKSPTTGNIATARQNAGGGGHSQPRNTSLLKKRKQSTKLIQRSHKWERHNPSSCALPLPIVTMMMTGILEALEVLTTPVNHPLYPYP
jgi:hypothetical protein